MFKNIDNKEDRSIFLRLVLVFLAASVYLSIAFAAIPYFWDRSITGTFASIAYSLAFSTCAMVFWQMPATLVMFVVVGCLKVRCSLPEALISAVRLVVFASAILWAFAGHGLGESAALPSNAMILAINIISPLLVLRNLKGSSTDP